MANVDIRLGHKNTAWFTTNSTLVLKDGQMVVCSDGANQGKYKIGDGTTQLSALTFYGGVSVSPAWGSITGTLSSQTDLQTALNGKQNTITTGTTAQYLRGDLSLATFPTAVSSFTNDAGYLTSSAIGVTIQGYSANTTLLGNSTTGSGSIVLATSPTFGTDITTPLIIGGTGVTSKITYKGTSGNGTSTATAHEFVVGNNGATTALKVLNSGNINIGNAVDNPAPTLGLVRIGQGDTWIDIGSSASLTPAIWLQTATPTASNYTLRATTTTATLNGGNTVRLSVGNSSVLSINSNNETSLTPDNSSSGAIVAFNLISPTNTGQTASTNISNFKVTGSTKTWAAGTITNQYWNYFSANTAAFASASTITNSYGLFVESASAGSNCTITNNYAAGFGGAVQITGAVSAVGIINTGNASFSGFLNMNSQPIRFLAGTAASPGLYFESNTCGIFSSTANVLGFSTNGTSRVTISTTDLTISDTFNISFNTTTGSKIGTATTQKLAFWNATPIVQPTTAVAAAIVVSGTGGNVKHDDTFDGYTLEQIVKALRNIGLLA